MGWTFSICPSDTSLVLHPVIWRTQGRYISIDGIGVFFALRVRLDWDLRIQEQDGEVRVLVSLSSLLT